MLCVSYSSPPLIFIGRSIWVFNRRLQQGSLVNRLKEAAMKLHLKAGGRWWGPPVGQTPWSADQWVPPVATAFAQEASWWVPMVLPCA